MTTSASDSVPSDKLYSELTPKQQAIVRMWFALGLPVEYEAGNLRGMWYPTSGDYDKQPFYEHYDRCFRLRPK